MVLYLGCDPGADGAVVGLECGFADSSVIRTKVLRLKGLSRETLWSWLRKTSSEYTCYAVLEQILPSGISGASKSSFAKLYGSFCDLRAFLIAAGIPTEEVLARDWLREFGVSVRKKGESVSHWKRRHKDCAQSLMNGREITVSAADGWLLAERCRRARNDLLTGGTRDGEAA